MCCDFLIVTEQVHFAHVHDGDSAWRLSHLLQVWEVVTREVFKQHQGNVLHYFCLQFLVFRCFVGFRGFLGLGGSRHQLEIIVLNLGHLSTALAIVMGQNVDKFWLGDP